jgi:hypothetical protein
MSTKNAVNFRTADQRAQTRVLECPRWSMPVIPRGERLHRLQPPRGVARGVVAVQVVRRTCVAEDVPRVRSDAPLESGKNLGPFSLVDVRGDGHHRCGLHDAVDGLPCDVVLLVNALAVRVVQARGEGGALADRGYVSVLCDALASYVLVREAFLLACGGRRRRRRRGRRWRGVGRRRG